MEQKVFSRVRVDLHLVCLITHAFGRPVVPDVYTKQALSIAR